MVSRGMNRWINTLILVTLLIPLTAAWSANNPINDGFGVSLVTQDNKIYLYHSCTGGVTFTAQHLWIGTTLYVTVDWQYTDFALTICVEKYLEIPGFDQLPEGEYHIIVTSHQYNRAYQVTKNTSLSISPTTDDALQSIIPIALYQAPWPQYFFLLIISTIQIFINKLPSPTKANDKPLKNNKKQPLRKSLQPIIFAFTGPYGFFTIGYGITLTLSKFIRLISLSVDYYGLNMTGPWHFIFGLSNSYHLRGWLGPNLPWTIYLIILGLIIVITGTDILRTSYKHGTKRPNHKNR